MITKVATVSVPVADQQRAKEFYCDKLGFTVVQERPFMNGAQWIELAPSDESSAHLVLTTWFDSMPAGSVQGLILWVKDVNEAQEGWANRGVDASPVEDAPWGKFFRVTDSEGNKLVIQQAR